MVLCVAGDERPEASQRKQNTKSTWQIYHSWNKSNDKETPKQITWRGEHHYEKHLSLSPLIVMETGSRFVPAIFMLAVLVRSWELVLLYNFLFLTNTLDIPDNISLYKGAL